MKLHSVLKGNWNALDEAALGVIYGSILVLSILMALEEVPVAPFRPALVLFGSILAVTLAKAFSELLAHAVQTHEKILTQASWVAAWRQSRATLAVVNLPTLAILAAGLGWIDFHSAVSVSQAFCVTMLAILGARVGWSIHPNSWLPIAGAFFVGGIGTGLAVLKYVIH
jgi:hypothetical protein